MKEKRTKRKVNWKWFIEVFIATFLLSIAMSYVSTYGVEKLSIGPAIIILFVVILIGIIFDIIGVAVQVAGEDELHAKATKKVHGAKESILLVRHSAKVANVCADVVGDICGVLSGTIGALVSIKLAEKCGLPQSIQVLITAFVAALTVGGKAIGKEIANNNSTKIVHFAGQVIGKFNKKN